MDIATVIGLVVGVAVLVTASGGGAPELYDGTALLLVVLGGFAATLVAFPLREIGRIPSIVRQVLYSRASSPKALIERIVHFAECARRGGILSLEQELAATDPGSLKAGVMLAMDGTEPALISDILGGELREVEERHALGAEMVQTLGRNWATFGVIGALLTLVMESGAESAGLGGAALPLLYGAVLAGLVAWPFRCKLVVVSEGEVLSRRLIIEGIGAIQAGDNPRLVEHKLSVLLAPFRPSDKTPALVPPPAAPDGKGAEEITAYAAANEERILAAVAAAIAARDDPEEDKAEGIELVERARRKELAVMAVLARLEESVCQQVLKALKSPPPVEPSAVADTESFSFEDIRTLTDRETQVLLREVDQRDLVFALKGASRELIDKVLGNMSERVCTFILHEVALCHPTPPDIFMTQARVVAQVFQLVKQGHITLPK